MKTKNEFETSYAKTLKECITLIDQENHHEKEKISLALEIGKKVDELAAQSPDNEILFKRLSRDIFRVRGKIISPSRIYEYQQLYLNFHSMDTVTTMATSMMSDVTVGMLTEMALEDGRPESKPTQDASPLLMMLKKANRLLDRFEVTIEDKQPEDKELSKILEELKLIGGKSEAILNAVQNAGDRSQLDLFKRRDTSLPVAVMA